MTTAFPTRPARYAVAVLPFLLLLSGFCGISYEILYAKMLGNLLGNQFTINATVLLTFLLGIGLGTLHAHRMRGLLWAIEAGIGAAAVLMALGFPALDRFVYTALPFLGTNLYAAALVCLALLSIPAFLIGCSVPLFADYLAATRERRVFATTYAIYNLGAAATALALEFGLLRLVGLRSATLILASLNGLVAAGLLLAGRALHLPPLVERARFPARVLAALVLASIASAMLQLLAIKIAEFILGPFNETFSLVLAVVLFGIAGGAFLAGRLRWAFHHAALLGLAGTSAILLFFPLLVGTFARLHEPAARSYLLLVGLKLLLVLGLLGLAAVGFGATIPALLHTHRQVARESGQLLFYASLANALGFLLMAFVLHRWLDYGQMLVVVAALASTAVFVERGWRQRGSLIAAGMGGLCVVALASLWNEGLLYVGHTEFHSAKDLRAARRSNIVDQRFKGAQDVFAITRIGGNPYFFINGYISIPLLNPSEKYVGAISAMLAPRTDRALVLGVGSGATAGTVGLIFSHTDGVEINPVVLDNLHHMAEYSFDIARRPDVTIVHDDGMHFIKTGTERYSLILNTVTTPLYFSSSKLYTLDFLELVQRRLAPDGVYVTWVDNRIGDRGLDIVLETLSRAFRHCWLLYVKHGYFLLVCSNEQPSFRQFDAVAGHVELGQDLARRHSMPSRLLIHSLITTRAQDLRSPGPIGVNTLDFPALEFEMARSRRGIPQLLEKLKRTFDIAEVRREVSRATPWNPGESAFHAALRLDADSVVWALYFEALFPPQADRTELDDAGLSLAQQLGGAATYYRYGKVLRDLERFDAAATALERAVELEPERDNANYYLAQVNYARGDDGAALVHFTREWEFERDVKVPLPLAMTLCRLGRFEEALRWLDLAQALGSRRERKEVALWQGVASEGLGLAAQAEQYYLDALREDSGYLEASLALERLTAADGAQTE